MTQDLSIPSPEILETVYTGFEAGTVVFNRDDGIHAGIKVKKNSDGTWDVEHTIFHDPKNKNGYQKMA